MKLNPKQINRLILRAQKMWGLEDWTIEWQSAKCDYEGDIEIRFTERYALISLDKEKITDLQNLRRTIIHEVGHCLLIIVERGIDDFAEHYIKDKKARAVFWEQVNTRQNEILDHLIVKVFKI